MSTMYFDTITLARVVVELGASVDDVLTFARANAKAWNAHHKGSTSVGYVTSSKTELNALAERVKSGRRLSRTELADFL